MKLVDDVTRRNSGLLGNGTVSHAASVPDILCPHVSFVIGIVCFWSFVKFLKAKLVSVESKRLDNKMSAHIFHEIRV